MMRYLNNLGLLFLFATLIFTSCRKNDEVFGVFPPSVPTPDVIVNGSFSGTVIDDNNDAVEAALVSFGSESQMTDENGYFTFRNVEINTKGSLVSVDKDGYFYGAKFVNSELNKQNFTTIKLIEKVQTGSFQTGAGGTITTSGGATIAFAANSIKQENGGAYTGTVKVYATWLDPTASDLTQRMPGDLRAINLANEQQQLTTYGMIGVELEGEAGEALNIAEGQTATITLPVPTTLAFGAPTSIPLWHFDEITGYWIEDGEALLQGGTYVGTVSHFSFWNCDVPSDFIFLEGTVIDRSENPIPNVSVEISVVASGMTGYDFTDENGAFSGFVPNDQELIITIFDNCGEQIYTAPIGPFSEDTVLPTITAAPTDDFLIVTGMLVDCDNNPVMNGYLKLDVGSSTVFLPTDDMGNFSGSINTCDATMIDVIGYDLINLTQSQPQSLEIGEEDTIDLATVLVCDELEQFAAFSVAGIEAVDPTPFAIFATTNGLPDTLVISLNDPDPTISTRVDFRVVITSVPGSYEPFSLQGFYVDPVEGLTILRCDGMCGVTVEFTTYDTFDGQEFIEGSFSGTAESLGGIEGEVEGSFRIFLQ